MENGWYRTTRFQNSPVFLKIRDSVQRTITGLTDPTGNPKEVQVLQKMEQ